MRSEPSQRRRESHRIHCRTYYQRNRERINSAKRAKRAAARALNPPPPPRFPNTPEGRRARRRAWLASLTEEQLTEYRARKRASLKRWETNNRDRHLAGRRARRERNRDQRSAAYRAWYERNREQLLERKRVRLRGPEREHVLALARIAASRRRARKHASQGKYTQGEWELLVRQADGRCNYCGERSDDLQPDHVIPLARGGSNQIDNIVPACRECNQRKHTQTADEFTARFRRRS